MTESLINSAGEGTRRIAAERIRQKTIEGWTPEHDAQHKEGELSVAAACYAIHHVGEHPHEYYVAMQGAKDMDAWPWAEGWDKRDKHDRIRRLEIAGALIAAEIDRLLAAGVGRIA